MDNGLRIIIFVAMSRFLVYLLLLQIVLFPAISIAQSGQGKASFYASRFHGRKMASGEIYHRDSLTCAHRTLPFGTKLRVTNLENGKEVVVTVQDRGPFVRGRIVDLSKQAAREISMIGDGIVNVQIKPYTEIRVPYLAYDSIPRLPFVPKSKPSLKLDPHTLEAYLR